MFHGKLIVLFFQANTHLFWIVTYLALYYGKN